MMGGMQFRDPQDHPRPSDSLEGPTERKKAILFTVTVYYSKGIWIKISHRKKHIGQCLGDQQVQANLQLSFPNVVVGSAQFSYH